MIEFRILGSMEIAGDNVVVAPTPPKVRQVLALLILSANQVVHVDSFIDELWENKPPPSAITTIQTYIYHLRRFVAKENLTQPTGELVRTKAPGYMLRTDRMQIDEQRFRQLARQGRNHLDNSEFELTSHVLNKALSLWSGPALADVNRGRVLEAQVQRLDEERLQTIETKIQADFALGRHREHIGELRALTSTYPLNEWFHGRLIEALGRTGRRSEALHAYQRLRLVLNDELGLDPSPELQDLQREVLA